MEEKKLIYDVKSMENFFELLKVISKNHAYNVRLNYKKSKNQNFVLHNYYFNNTKIGYLRTLKLADENSFKFFDVINNNQIIDIKIDKVSLNLNITPINFSSFLKNINNINNYVDEEYDINKEAYKLYNDFDKILSNCDKFVNNVNKYYLVKFKIDIFEKNKNEIIETINNLWVQKIKKSDKINNKFIAISDKRFAYIIFIQAKDESLLIYNVDTLNLLKRKYDCMIIYKPIIIPIVGTLSYGNKVEFINI